MHLKRWITALILVPVLFLILLKGPALAFTLVVILVTFSGLNEYLAIVTAARDSSGSHKTPIPLLILTHVMGAAIICAAHSAGAGGALAMVAVNLLIVALVVVLTFSQDSTMFTFALKQIMGIVYLPLFLSFLVLMRNSHQGAVWVIWTFLIVAASDTGAFYVGTHFGRHKLAPRVSPNKSVEGSVAGILAAIVVGVVFDLLFIENVSLLQAASFSALAAAVGQVGDLFESALKRRGGIKDSGSILPGHGGILDRIDGLIFALPLAFAFKSLLG
ncbi:MAG: phosphatidate cytidylyltransferase [Desulfobacterium sp.]|jgi:phosphatidate cytidylyltransferase|nr:phosphatidate cytidylyltransferase [Desulfobacterium sp.]